MNDTERKPDLKKRESSTGQHDDLGLSQEDAESDIEELENLYSSSPSKTKGGFWTKKKKSSAAVVGAVGGVAIIAGLFFTPLLKLESYMQGINQRAFAVGASAVEARSSYLFEQYMIGYLADMGSCTKAASLDCRKTYAGNGLVAGLYRNWSDAKIEEKLFDEYGFEIETKEKDGVVEHVLKDRRGGEIDLSKDADGTFRNIVSSNGKRETGREIRRFMKDNTKWYQVMERKSVRKLLDRKHGIKTWCMMACKSRDNIDNVKQTAAFKYKSKFINRFVSPFSSKWGFILQCMVSGSCSNKDINEVKIARKALSDDDIKLFKKVIKTPNQSLTQVMLRNILQKLVVKELITDRAVNAIPIVGQILLIAVIVDLIEETDTFVANNGFSKFAASINSTQYLEFYTATRSDNDAMKAGALDIEDVGEISSYFDGAEQSLVYKTYNGDSSSEDDPEYLCKDGKPVDVIAGDLVCEEKKIQRTYLIEQIRNSVLVDATANDVLDYYRPVKPVVSAILTGIDKLSDLILGNLATLVIGGLRGCEDLDSIDREPTEKELSECNFIDDFIRIAGDYFADFVDSIFARIFPLPVTLDSPGREFYDGLEAGADVAANSFAAGGVDGNGETYGLGAPTINDSDVAAIFDEALTQQAYEYNSKNLIERTVDTEYRNSFANILISRVPSNPTFARFFSSLASSFMNLINGSLFSSFIVPITVSAGQYEGSQLAVNAFGVERYGYKIDDPVITADPDLYTEEYCETLSRQREDSKTEHDITGLEKYISADPCQLERTVIEAAGGYLNDD
jgi:hypothetical protein